MVEQIEPARSGSFGKCILVKNKEGKQYVLKSVDTSRMSSKERKCAMNEVKVTPAGFWTEGTVPKRSNLGKRYDEPCCSYSFVMMQGYLR